MQSKPQLRKGVNWSPAGYCPALVFRKRLIMIARHDRALQAQRTLMERRLMLLVGLPPPVVDEDCRALHAAMNAEGSY